MLQAQLLSEGDEINSEVSPNRLKWLFLKRSVYLWPVLISCWLEDHWTSFPLPKWIGGGNKNKQKTAENPQTNFHGIQRRVLMSPAVQEQTFYFIMQTATYELYYLPKGAGKRSYTRGKINHTVCVKSKSNTYISLSHKGKIHPKNNMYIPLMSDSSFLLCGFNWVSPNSRNMGSRTFTFLCRHHRRKTWLYIKVSGLWKDRWSISVLTCTQIWSELCIIVIKWILQGFCFTKAFYQSFSTHKYSSGENWTFN